MKNLLKGKKIISSFLVVLLLMISTNIPVFADSAIKNSVTIDGYIFNVVQKDVKKVVLTYDDNVGNYTFSLDRNTSEIKASIKEKVKSKSAFLSSSLSNSKKEYIFTIDDYYGEGDLDILKITDISNGIIYDTSSSENYRMVFTIPLGIPLGEAAIKALLAIGAAILVGNVAYTLAEEIAYELTKEDFRYYAAILKNKKVYIGGAYDYAKALRVVRADNPEKGVFATSLTYAIGLAGKNYRGPENHGGGSGYWDHIHAYMHPKTHIWFFG